MELGDGGRWRASNGQVWPRTHQSARAASIHHVGPKASHWGSAIETTGIKDSDDTTALFKNMTGIIRSMRQRSFWLVEIFRSRRRVMTTVSAAAAKNARRWRTDIGKIEAT